MRIERLKLVNFIGIKNSLGKDEVEITFPDNGNIITMLNGGNGSGKSTIMSQLTPFKESFDDRKSLILPNKEGLKEIDISHNGHSYKIKHVYSKVASSFISKDGIELNENGGVRTFEEIVREEFKLDKEYFKIGKIGSNTESFIQFTTTQRKTYISNFIEAVKKYIDAYKIVADKAKLNEQQIKQISNDLKKFNSIDEVKNKIAVLQSKSVALDNEITNTNNLLIKQKIDIDNLKEKISNIDYLSAKTELQRIEEHIARFNKLCEKISITDNVHDIILLLKKELDDLTTEKNNIDAEMKSASEKLVDIDNSILKLNSANIVATDLENINSIKEKINSETNELAEIEKKSSNTAFKYIEDNYNDIPQQIDNFKVLFKNILSQHDILTRTDINNTENYKNIFNNQFDKILADAFTKVNTRITDLSNAIDNDNIEHAKISANLFKLEILEKRPATCVDDSCPFIADALAYSGIDKKLVVIEERLDKNRAEKEYLTNTVLDNLLELKNAYSNIVFYFKKMGGSNILYKYFVKLYGTIENALSLPVNEIERKYSEVISYFENVFSIVNRKRELENLLNVDKIQYERALDAEKTNKYFETEREKLLTDKTILINNRQTNNERLDIISKDIESKSEKLKEYSDFVEDMNDNDANIKERNRLLDLITQYETSSKMISSYEESVSILTNKIVDLQNNKKDILESITNMKATEITINQLQQNMSSLTKTFNNIDIVKKALSPKSGIPLIFIQSYLDGTESVANELLNIAYSGKFAIHFVPTATDFYIQVKCGNNIIDDIKLASQGEISMTTISLSLALIERALGEYNIMYLDEIDGPLDIENRESFINILNKQISKLGLEQIFVISHNNAFESCAMNLILLNGNTVDKTDEKFMENKEIIFEV